MEEKSLARTVVRNISDFDSILSSKNAKHELVQKYYRQVVEILNLVKPIFAEVFCQITPDEQHNSVMEELHASINEAREHIGSWNLMTSKVYFVLQIESAMAKIKADSLELCHAAKYSTLSAKSNYPSICSENLQQIKHEAISGLIREAAKDVMRKANPNADVLAKISKCLCLTTNLELLVEVVALHKLLSKASSSEHGLAMDSVDHLVELVTYMHETHVKKKQLNNIKGVPVPPDFCCPLSLELMSDPVIVASGQTYERAFIRKWLDLGYNICPKTCQPLGHSNLIPNYTVKALILNWCESHDIKLPDPLKSLNSSFPAISSNSHSGANVLETNSSAISLHENGSPQQSYVGETTKADNQISKGIPHDPNGLKSSSPAMLAATSGSEKGPEMELRLVGSDGQIWNRKDGGVSAVSTDEMRQSNNCKESTPGVASSFLCVQASHEDSTGSQVSSDGETSEGAHGAPNPVPKGDSEISSRLVEGRQRNPHLWRRPAERFRIVPSHLMDSRPDLSGVETQVRKLLEDLKSNNVEVQRASAKEIRLLSKHSMENRIVIANCGAISLLVELLSSSDLEIQEHAVTAILNLSLNDNNKTAIGNANAIDPLIHVLKTGNDQAKENSAATLFSLCMVEEYKMKIGRSGAIEPLVDLLRDGTLRGKKDAATALYNLSIFPENKLRIVQSGAVKHLVELMDPCTGLVDKAVLVLSNLSSTQEGRTAIGSSGGIPLLVEVVELGSVRAKENAAAALLQLCKNSHRFCSQVLQEGAVPPLVILSQSGTPRAREKAQALLGHFRSLRHGNPGRSGL